MIIRTENLGDGQTKTTIEFDKVSVEILKTLDRFLKLVELHALNELEKDRKA